MFAMTANVTIRAATANDGEDILRWRNDPVTQRMSRNTGEIARDAHLEWYASVLGNPARLLLIGCVDDVAIGMARFDQLAPHTWDVSINLDPARRGDGLSRGLLAAALKEIALRKPRTIVAEIKPINAVSRHLFESLGFRLVSRGSLMDRFELVL